MKKKMMSERFLRRKECFFGLLMVVFFGMNLSVSAQTFPPPPPPLPSFPEPMISLSVNPVTMVLGQSATISWSSENTTSCVASGAWSGSKTLSGSESVSPTETSVYALTCAGSFLGSAEESVTVTVSPGVPDTTKPTKPTSLAGTVVSSSQINLSWTASTDPIVSGQVTSGVAEYRIERCKNSGCTNFVQVGTSIGTTYSNTELSANTRYRYRVRAVDGAGNLSSYSSVIGKMTL